MAKKADDSVLDAGLAVVQTANGQTLNTTEPADRAGAISDSLIPTATPSFAGPASGGGGRQLTVNASNGNTASGSGTASHVSLFDASTLLFVTTCTNTVVTATNTVNIGNWIITFVQPV